MESKLCQTPPPAAALFSPGRKSGVKPKKGKESPRDGTVLTQSHIAAPASLSACAIR